MWVERGGWRFAESTENELPVSRERRCLKTVNVAAIWKPELLPTK